MLGNQGGRGQRVPEWVQLLPHRANQRKLGHDAQPEHHWLRGLRQARQRGAVDYVRFILTLLKIIKLISALSLPKTDVNGNQDPDSELHAQEPKPDRLRDQQLKETSPQTEPQQDHGLY